MTTEKTFEKLVDLTALVDLRRFALATAAAVKAAEAASTILVRAAIHSAAKFSETVEAFYTEIRKNVDGLAVAIGAEQNKAKDGYTIPASIQAQVSQVLRGQKFGVDMGTEANPKGLGEIRTATAKAAEAEQAEASKAALLLLTGDDAIRVKLLAGLEEVSASIKSLEGPALAEVATATAAYISFCGTVTAKANAAKAAAKAAKEAKPEATPAPAEVMAAAAAPAAMLPNGKAAGKRSRKAA